jgi:hypothetical protein
MNGQEATREYRLAHWTQLLQDHRESGMTAKDWCLTQGIPRTQYFYWKRKLRDSAAQMLTAMSGPSLPTPSGWAVAETVMPEPRSAIRIEVGGCTITATAETDEALLLRVCRILRQP